MSNQYADNEHQALQGDQEILIKTTITADISDLKLPWDPTESREDNIVATSIGGDPLPACFKRVQSLELLGCNVKANGRSAESVEYRIAKADNEWNARRMELTNKHVPLRARLQRFNTTVMRTLLWGSGIWKLTQRQAKQRRN